jgi:ABC-type bacteriocin/lantibiotic exporter with double-glycine peptidase domain
MQKIIDAIATTAARIEALTHPNAIILPNFTRSIQLDSYSCGAHSVYTILKYFRKHCTTVTVEKQLGTDEDGTSTNNIKRVLRTYGLNIRVNTKMNMWALKETINTGSSVLVSLYEGWHYSVVYRYSSKHIFIMNPSLGSMGSLFCAVRKDRFRRIWDRYGIVVSSLK